MSESRAKDSPTITLHYQELELVLQALRVALTSADQPGDIDEYAHILTKVNGQYVAWAEGRSDEALGAMTYAAK